MSNKPPTTGHNPVTIAKELKLSDFGAELIQARLELSWTRKFLSEQTKPLIKPPVHENTIYNIERGKTCPSLDVERMLKLVISGAVGRNFPWSIAAAGLSKEALLKFIMTSDLVSEIDQAIAKSRKLRVLMPDTFLETYLNKMVHMNLSSITDLERGLRDKQQLLVEFGVECFKDPILRLPFVPRGMCIGGLQMVTLIERSNMKVIADYIREHGFDRSISAMKRARALKAAYNSALKRLN